MSDPYDEVVGQLQQEKLPLDPADAAVDGVLEEQRSKLRTSLYGSLLQNPDTAAKAAQISRRSGIPAEVVERNLPEVERSQKLDEYDRLLKDSPGLGKFLTNTDNAKISHDDVGNLATTEASVRALRGPAPTVGSYLHGLYRTIPQGLEAARQGVRMQFADLIGSKEMHADAMRKFAGTSLDIAATTPEFESTTAKGIYGGLSSTLRQGPGIAAAIVMRSPGVVLTTMGLQTEAEAYGKYKARGASSADALYGAVHEGAIEVATEMLPMSFLVKKFGKEGFGKFLGGLLLREAPTEQLATFLQDAVDTAVANPDKSWAQFLAERPEAAYETFVATVTQAGVMGAANTVVGKLNDRTSRAADTEKNSKIFSILDDLSKASKVRERDPKTFENFVKQATEDGPVTDVFVDARVFAQSLQDAGADIGVVAQAAPAVAEQLQEALATGGDLRIPVEQYASAIAGSDFSQSLIPHLKTEAGGMTQLEAADFMQNHGRELEAMVDKVLGEKQGDEEFKASRDKVVEDMRQQLNSIGRFTDDVNLAKATLVGNFYAVQGAKLGMTAEEFSATYGLEVRSTTAETGIAMDQTSPGFTDWFKASKAVDEEGKPQRMYIGTPNDIGAFRIGESGAIWATKDPEFAGRFATRGMGETDPSAGFEEGLTPNVMPVYVSAQNPFDYQDQANLDGLEAFLRERAGEEDKIVVELFGENHTVSTRTFMARVKDGTWDIIESPLAQEYIKANHDSFYTEEEGRKNLAVYDPTQIKSATGNNGNFDPNDPNVLKQQVFHGTPHVWPPEPGFPHGRPRLDKIGSGEGNQSYGWGWYSAESKDVGVSYRDTLSDSKHYFAVDGEYQFEGVPNTPRKLAISVLAHGDSVEYTTQLLKGSKQNDSAWIREFVAEAKKLEGKKVERKTDTSGTLYSLDIPDSVLPNLLNWDKPQTPEILARMGKAAARGESRLDEALTDILAYSPRDFGSNIYLKLKLALDGNEGDGKEVSEYLASIGIVGNRYLDGDSRADGTGTSNFVIWDQPTLDQVALLERNGEKLDAIREADAAEGNTFFQSVTLRTGKETLKKYGLDPGGKHKTRDVGAALEARQREKYGLIGPDDRSDEAAKKIAKWMIEEIQFEMQHPEKSGVGWYSEKFQRALDKFARAFPELETDKTARDTLTILIAVASDGQKVMPNFRMAIDIYGNFRKTGKFATSIGHARKESIDKNLVVIQDLYEKLGPDGMREYMMQEATVAELRAIARSEDETFNTAYESHIRLPMAAIQVGPKLGAFYANLMGAFGYLTMDRWWSRTFNRYRGTLVMAPTESGKQNVKNLLGNPEMSDDELLSAIIAPRNSYAAKNFKEGTELERSANTVYKMAFENLEDSPFNAGDRSFMLKTVALAKKGLSRRGIKMSIADIQATLWYYEKRLYGDLGTVKTADISYEEAAIRVIEELLNPQPKKPKKPKKPKPGDPDAGGSGGRAVPVDGETEQQDDGGGLAESDAAEESSVPIGEEVYPMGNEGAGSGGTFGQSSQLKTEQPARGSIRFADDITAAPSIISLLQNADLSTFLHESGHFFLQVMADMSTRPGAPAAVTEDMNRLLQWFGVPDLATWNSMSVDEQRPHHEAFARGFEAYLLEGKAPTPELAPIYQKFRAWLLNVYKQILQLAKGDASFALKVTLSPEVRAVMDRMLATSETIKEAEDTQGYGSLFDTKPDGMTDTEWAEYQEVGQTATQDAINYLEGRSLRDMRWASNARSAALKNLQKDADDKRAAVRGEVAAEVLAEPINQVRAFLRDGEIDGDPVPGPHKLSIEALEEMYGGEGDRYALLDWKALSTSGVAGKEGIHPDEMAADFGFRSGDELVQALLQEDTAQGRIDSITDQRMLERYGDLTDPATIERAANEAIHNSARIKFVATEAAALDKAAGQKPVLLKAAKAFAEAAVARKLIRDIKPHEYSAAARKAAKAAAKAMKAGDLQAAAVEKRNQLVNEYAAQAAHRAVAEVDKRVAYLKQVGSTRAQEKMRGDSAAQLLAILDRFDIRKAQSLKEIDRRQALSEWAKEEAARLAAPEPILSQKVLDEANRTHFKNLSMEEFRGLVDSIRQLEKLARREHKMFIELRNLSVQEEVAAGVAEIQAAFPEAFDGDQPRLDTPLTNKYVPSLGKKLQEGIRNIIAEFIPMEDLVDRLTAGKFGQLHDSIFGRLSDAADRKAMMAGGVRERLKPLLDAYSMREKRDFARKEIPGTNMTRENIVMLALHWGNEEGRQRLESQGFSEAIMVQRLKHLTAKDIALVQGIWDLNDSWIWPQYSDLNQRTQGKSPAKVQPVPFTFTTTAGSNVTLAGGYIKLVYDSDFDESTRQRDSMADAISMIAGRTGSAAPKTDQGSSKERISDLSRMPLLELRAVAQAVNEHLHDITFREAVADTVRVLREPKMRDAIKAVAGKEVYTELLAKVNEIAARPVEPSGAVLRGLNIARRNTVVVLMSGVKTALVNYSGLVPALTRVNAGSLIKNLGKVHSHRMVEMIRFAQAKSIYMRERQQNFTSDLQHQLDAMSVKNRILPEMGTFLILMRWIDQLTSTTVWLSGYEDGLKRFKLDDGTPDEARAVEYANNVTRSTQGSGREVDTSKIMTRFGPWSKLFTMFYSFFNKQAALLARQGLISEREWVKGNRVKAVGMFTASYVAIVAVPAMINDLAGGKCDDAIEGSEGWGRCVSKALAMNMAGFVPVVRDVAPYAWSLVDDKEPTYGLRMTSISAYFEGIAKGGAATLEVLKGDGDEKDTKKIFMGLAFSFGLPGVLAWNMISGTGAFLEGEAGPQAVLFGPPKK